jgi:hypothetical protein
MPYCGRRWTDYLLFIVIVMLLTGCAQGPVHMGWGIAQPFNSRSSVTTLGNGNGLHERGGPDIEHGAAFKLIRLENRSKTDLCGLKLAKIFKKPKTEQESIMRAYLGVDLDKEALAKWVDRHQWTDNLLDEKIPTGSDRLLGVPYPRQLKGEGDSWLALFSNCDGRNLITPVDDGEVFKTKDDIWKFQGITEKPPLVLEQAKWSLSFAPAVSNWKALAIFYPKDDDKFSDQIVKRLELLKERYGKDGFRIVVVLEQADEAASKKWPWPVYQHNLLLDFLLGPQTGPMLVLADKKGGQIERYSKEGKGSHSMLSLEKIVRLILWGSNYHVEGWHFTEWQDSGSVTLDENDKATAETKIEEGYRLLRIHNKRAKPICHLFIFEPGETTGIHSSDPTSRYNYDALYAHEVIEPGKNRDFWYFGKQAPYHIRAVDCDFKLAGQVKNVKVPDDGLLVVLK